MTKTAIWTLILSLVLATTAVAATDEEKCQKKKLIALGKRDLCVEKESAKDVLGKTPSLAACDEKFGKAITKADEAAAKKGASCRWLDLGDGTARDLNSGLQWELKTDDGSIHDKDDTYSWAVLPDISPGGTAFLDFLWTLNFAVTEFGEPGGCFADKCDWRLPTITELYDIADLDVPGCGGGSPCSTIPGETALSHYWSYYSHLAVQAAAFDVDFGDGSVNLGTKSNLAHVRAVRGGS